MDESVELKAFGPLEVKDAEQGEVEAVVATLNIVDKDGDVILPGAVPAGGAKVKMSGYGHDIVKGGAAPVGKGMITEENGKAVFRGKFFMTTERGREAFHTVKELGGDGEWSFGFPNRGVRTAELTKEWKTKGARRLITGMLPVEASPVLVGAGFGTGTVGVKEVETPPVVPESVEEAPPETPPEPVTPDEEAMALYRQNQDEWLRR